MDFIIGLLISSRRHDAIMVTINRLTKVTHVSSIQYSYIVGKVARVFMEDIARLHGIPCWIISD